LSQTPLAELTALHRPLTGSYFKPPVSKGKGGRGGAENAPKSLETGALSQTPLAELTALHRPLTGSYFKPPDSKGNGGRGAAEMILTPGVRNPRSATGNRSDRGHRHFTVYSSQGGPVKTTQCKIYSILFLDLFTYSLLQLIFLYHKRSTAVVRLL